MLATIRSTVSIFAILTLLTGVVYPITVTVIARSLFPYEASGKIIESDGKALDAEGIGRTFAEPHYFHGRPSALTIPYDPSTSGGSNLGPTNPDFLKIVRERVDLVRLENPDETGPVPVELVAASASGLDPHIGPAAAKYQALRVAKARGIPKEQVLLMIAEHTRGRTFGILGEPRINFVLLNRALDESQNRR